MLSKQKTNPTTYLKNGGVFYALPLKEAKIYRDIPRTGCRLIKNCKPCYENILYKTSKVYEKPNGFFTNLDEYFHTVSEPWALELFRQNKLARKPLADYFQQIIDKEDKLYKLSKSILTDISAGSFKDGFTFRDHQPVILEYAKLSGRNSLLICDQQRTGKTYTALCYVASLKFKKCLIVCPAGVINDWERMLFDIFEESEINLTILNKYDEIQNGYNVISYDKLHTIENLDVDVAVIDEIHYINKTNARRTYACNRISATYAIGLSGTPMLNDINEMMPILKFLDDDLHKEIQTFIKYGTFENEYETALLVSRLLRRRCMMLRLADQISPESKVFINTVEVNTGLDKTALITEVGAAKIPYAVDYANTYDDEKLIIACYYLKTAKKLVASLGSRAVLISGETPQEQRMEAKEAFREGASILVATSCIAEGQDFSFANRMLIIETGYSFRVDQLKERCNRVGKSEMVCVDIMIDLATKDYRVEEIINNKYGLNEGLRDS
jgi:superfamily II DNA or RNA helicase